MNESDVFDALKKAYVRSGTQASLAQKTGLSQGRIADYLNKRYSVGNMTLSTLVRLFPELKMYFFEEDYPVKIKKNTIDVGGKVSGMILQNTKSAIHDVEQNKIGLSPETLSKRLRKDDRFSAEEKLKFLDFLDEQT